MILAVPKETFPGDRRVALVPAASPSLIKAGLEVIVQSGAGVQAGYADDAYQEKGARIVGDRAELFRLAGIVIQVRAFGANPDMGRSDLDLVHPGQVVVGFLDPLGAQQAVEELAARKVTAFAMELVPRIARAQSMDALSSMATVAGYKAVLLAAHSSSRMFPMLMTAAGTITPAKVFVVGAGVAGLQAIATARRLGAVVRAYDIRPAAKEQVHSLGARFVELGLESKQAEDAGGYAKEMDADFYRRQAEMMSSVVSDSDVVITTAAVPGKRAPVLVTAEMVAEMRPGSVIIDLAAERGGNCELTRPGETVTEHGVIIIGPLDLPATVPYHASQMYSKNISTFVLHLVKNGQLHIDLEDEITRETLVVREGEIVHPRLRQSSELTNTENHPREGETR